MSTRKYREEAHKEMRKLWEICDGTLRKEGSTEEVPFGDGKITRFETLGGAVIERMGDVLEVSCDFETATHEGPVEETVTITFSPDIRDLSDSKVSIEWHNPVTERMGTNTVGLANYSRYVLLMTTSVVPEFVQS